MDARRFSLGRRSDPTCLKEACGGDTEWQNGQNTGRPKTKRKIIGATYSTRRSSRVPLCSVRVSRVLALPGVWWAWWAWFGACIPATACHGCVLASSRLAIRNAQLLGGNRRLEIRGVDGLLKKRRGRGRGRTKMEMKKKKMGHS